ncbi:hypothetical protein H6G91_38585 [Nostoc muscorum FACHB-395]|nr:hypothetical protein [Desmonostoc muscorum FACHB-395]
MDICFNGFEHYCGVETDSVIGKSDRLRRETPFKAKPLHLLALAMLDRYSV